MARKKKPPEHENHERWLVSYADFITLLFAFFVVMFAVSQVDSQKMGRFVESVNQAFEYKGVFPDAAPFPIQGAGAGSGGGGTAIVPQKVTIINGAPLSRRGSDLRKAIESVIKKSRLSGRVKTKQDRRGVIVSLSEAGFFDPGSATMRADSLETLAGIGEMLKDSEVPIIVEGHTDNTPIHTAIYPSNWELSTARATSIVAYLIEQLHYDPHRLAAAGYSEYRPVADNDTPAGRAQNRRVDIVAMTEMAEAAVPKPSSAAEPPLVARSSASAQATPSGASRPADADEPPGSDPPSTPPPPPR